MAICDFVLACSPSTAKLQGGGSCGAGLNGDNVLVNGDLSPLPRVSVVEVDDDDDEEDGYAGRVGSRRDSEQAEEAEEEAAQPASGGQPGPGVSTWAYDWEGEHVTRWYLPPEG